MTMRRCRGGAAGTVEGALGQHAKHTAAAKRGLGNAVDRAVAARRPLPATRHPPPAATTMPPHSWARCTARRAIEGRVWGRPWRAVPAYGRLCCSLPPAFGAPRRPGRDRQDVEDNEQVRPERVGLHAGSACAQSQRISAPTECLSKRGWVLVCATSPAARAPQLRSPAAAPSALSACDRRALSGWAPACAGAGRPGRESGACRCRPSPLQYRGEPAR